MSNFILSSFVYNYESVVLYTQYNEVYENCNPISTFKKGSWKWVYFYDCRSLTPSYSLIQLSREYIKEGKAIVFITTNPHLNIFSGTLRVRLL